MSWRLARQLSREHGCPVSLWIDAPATLASIAPQALPGTRHDGVAIGAWRDAPPPSPLPAPGPRAIVSAFGCELPAAVRRALPTAPRTVWVNLEYLSAEPWIDGCHGLASRKPDDGAIEHFFYPGFTATSGGLLRERDLLQARDAFRAGGEAQRWLAQHGFGTRDGERLVSLFCYPDAPVAQLLELLAADARPTRLLLPEGVAREAVRSVFGSAPAPGLRLARGALVLECFALMPQHEYDRLLWSCELNFVRGEDSWIRALWAGSPFVWQPYRQSGGAHGPKLEAFLARFAAQGADAAAAGALMRAWDAGGELRGAWIRHQAQIEALARAHRAFAQSLAATPDLATRLLAFCERRLAALPA